MRRIILTSFFFVFFSFPDSGWERIVSEAPPPRGRASQSVCSRAESGNKLDDQTAISYGGGRCGKLEGGLSLPCSGDNFEAFTPLACLLGRNYLHPLVVKTIQDAYAEVVEKSPGRTWQYGDFGWKNGGLFRPHKTHQNGLAADFFVPMVNPAGKPVKVPTSLFNKFGYGLELDEGGRLEERTLDWTALTEHLLALERAGTKYGVAIRRIILAPEFHALWFRADSRAKKFRDRLIRGAVWVRHDEHYHIDFEIPPRLRGPLHCQ